MSPQFHFLCCPRFLTLYLNSFRYKRLFLKTFFPIWGKDIMSSNYYQRPTSVSFCTWVYFTTWPTLKNSQYTSVRLTLKLIFLYSKIFNNFGEKCVSVLAWSHKQSIIASLPIIFIEKKLENGPRGVFYRSQRVKCVKNNCFLKKKNLIKIIKNKKKNLMQY